MIHGGSFIHVIAATTAGKYKLFSCEYIRKVGYSMRVVGNYSTSLLNYLNNNISIKDVLSRKATGSLLSESAKKTLKENGITFDGSNTEDSSVYEKVQSCAEDLRTSILVLTNKGKDSVFAKAESSNDTSAVVKEITDFVDSYNNLGDAMNTMGGSANKKYSDELEALVTKNKGLFEKIGITMTEDKKLSINEDTLKNADIADLKAAFYDNEDSLDDIADKSMYAEANAISAMYSSVISNYTNSGVYSDSALSSFIKSV